ncbi:MAG: hypothetical protein ACOYM7_08200, partial [Paludibacter sp.]
MITVHTKIHDKFSLECKIAYKARRKHKVNDFMLNTWIFVPNSLDINPATYSREDFYKDIRTNTRLITPVFLMREIVSSTAIPLHNLESAMKHMASSPTRSTIAEFEYQIKMFSAIFKSAIRDQLAYIYNAAHADDKEQLVKEFLIEIEDILDKYRKLAPIIKTPTVNQVVYNYYAYGDEFMTNLTEKELFGIINKFKHQNEIELLEILKPLILEVLEKEKQHKITYNYLHVEPESSNKNKDLLFRLGALKKYVESDLFINAKKKRDGVLVEQVYLSIAAGLSMVFATGVAFSFQQTYGNLTMPFFVALVVSYMLKDRIKELMRFYFAQKISAKYYDNKTTISIKEKEIGISKEGFDFILDANIPKDILRVRNRIPLIEADNRYANEKIILFRKTVTINRKVLDNSSNYNIDGIVEIVRLNLLSFMRKTDNPEVPLFVLDENHHVERIMGIKNYYL